MAPLNQSSRAPSSAARQVGQEIVDVLDADRETEQGGIDRQARTGERGMGHAGRVLNERLDGAEGLGQREYRRGLGHLQGL